MMKKRIDMIKTLQPEFGYLRIFRLAQELDSARMI